MQVTPENTKTVVENMRAEGHTSRADYLELAGKNIRELQARLTAAQADEAEIGAYTLQMFGDRYHQRNGHDRSLALDACSYPTCVDLAAMIEAFEAAVVKGK